MWTAFMPENIFKMRQVLPHGATPKLGFPPFLHKPICDKSNYKYARFVDLLRYKRETPGQSDGITTNVIFITENAILHYNLRGQVNHWFYRKTRKLSTSLPPFVWVLQLKRATLGFQNGCNLSSFVTSLKKERPSCLGPKNILLKRVKNAL